MENEKKGIIRKVWNKIKFEWEMRRMDRLWRWYNWDHWQLFPPSFFYRHTPEEAERIVEETISYLQDVINHYAARENSTDAP